MVGMGIVILSNKPSMGEIMVERETTHNPKSPVWAKLWYKKKRSTKSKTLINLKITN